MATKKSKGLGRGLEALLGPKIDAADEAQAPASVARGRAPSLLPLTALRAGQYQPRTRMDEGALYELAESIKAQGIMQPILVRPLAQARASTKSSPASAAFAPPRSPAWTKCPCWCAKCPTKPPPPWR